jgi:DNA-binding response OmpR family regulator
VLPNALAGAYPAKGGKSVRGKTILIIEDDHTMVEIVMRVLESAGAQVYYAYDGGQGLKELYDRRPDLVLLDVMMPGIDGLEVLKRIRELSNVPVVMLTVKGSHEDVVRTLNAGADDHVTKPFHTDELLARIHAVLRRAETQNRGRATDVYDDGFLFLDLPARKILVSGEPVRLTAKEFDLLAFLVHNADRICTFDQILDNVWEVGHHASPQNVYTFIYQLRMKLEPDPRSPVYLVAAPGVGYAFRSATKS